MSRSPRSQSAISLIPVLFFLAAAPVGAQDAAADFKQNCVSCHTIGGGRLVGPDLKNVTERKDRPWLVNFILNPSGLINQGDPYARQLLSEARGVVMAAIPGMSKVRAEALLDLIEAESKLPKSRFMGAQISDRPFTAADVEGGKKIFLGTTRLKSGGVACLSCHRLQGLDLLGGGSLAPDLTKVFERLGGRLGLAAWLSAPATPTMQTLFAGHPLDEEELLQTIALLQNAAAQTGASDQTVARLGFILFGIGGAILALFLLDFIWKGRLRAVRRSLVETAAERGVQS